MWGGERPREVSDKRESKAGVGRCEEMGYVQDDLRRGGVERWGTGRSEEGRGVKRWGTGRSEEVRKGWRDGVQDGLRRGGV